jgi:hypothetical protein
VPRIDPTTLGIDATSVYATAEAGSAGTAPSRNKGTLKYLETIIAEKTGDTSFHLDKVAFARATVDVLTGKHDCPPASQEDLDVARTNFTTLLSQIALRQRAAERTESVEKISSRINRSKRDFTRTHHGQARKEDVAALIEEIGSQLDNSPEAEDVRTEMRKWFHLFDLDTEPRALVADYQGLIKAINGLAYQAIRGAAKK